MYIPIVPINCTLIPKCSSLFPSLGLTVTAPLTLSPSIYSGAFSLRFLSSLTSTICRSLVSSSTISISTGVLKKYDMLGGRRRRGGLGVDARCRSLGGERRLRPVMIWKCSIGLMEEGGGLASCVGGGSGSGRCGAHVYAGLRESERARPTSSPWGWDARGGLAYALKCR